MPGVHSKPFEPYRCPEEGCDYIIKSRGTKTRHGTSHKREKIPCPEKGCKYQDVWKSGMNSHLKIKHLKVKDKVCHVTDCDKRYLQKCMLQEHVASHIHSGEHPSHGCDECESLFPQDRDSGEPGTYQIPAQNECHICRNTLVSMSALRVHILTQHLGHGMADCDVCGAMVLKHEEFKKLNRPQTVKPKVKPMKKKLPCHAGDCRKQLATALMLKKHLVFDHDMFGEHNIHECKVCHTDHPDWFVKKVPRPRRSGNGKHQAESVPNPHDDSDDAGATGGTDVTVSGIRKKPIRGAAAAAAARIRKVTFREEDEDGDEESRGSGVSDGCGDVDPEKDWVTDSDSTYELTDEEEEEDGKEEESGATCMAASGCVELVSLTDAGEEICEIAGNLSLD